ncbi:MAG: hypothetical protein KME10_26825 [Plectolyngbya sp. WJT66-NPBG17]|nr:hypothetical protein [Plectolyngbya sp. WJT66-NPBG17]
MTAQTFSMEIAGLGQFFRHWDTAAVGQDLETLHEAITVARRNSNKRKRHVSPP